MKTWQSMSAEEREHHYNPQNSVKNFSSFQTFRTAVSRVCRNVMTAHLDVPYGEGPLHSVDIFPSTQGSPVHIFFHGGYWRAQDKENFAFIARDFVQRGVTVVIANYDLCPQATLDGVTASALDAIAWCHRNIGDYGGNPEAISISGNSAGAHLCAMALATDWKRHGLQTHPIKGAVVISGIYDPEPARHISVADDLNLDDDIVARNNALLFSPLSSCPVWIFAGGGEPWAWVEQSFDYSRHLRVHGHDPEVHVLPGYHHFNVMDQYLDPASPIAIAVRRACGVQ